MCASAATAAPDDFGPGAQKREIARLSPRKQRDGKKAGAMAIDDSSSSSFFAPWPDRLRHSAIILLAAGIVLSVLVAIGELALARAVAAFVCIAAAALVPWRLHTVAPPPGEARGVK